MPPQFFMESLIMEEPRFAGGHLHMDFTCKS
jgi:hypothetical protein